MKKLLVFILILLPLLTNAQSKRSLLKLKDGTEIKGIIKAIDPTDAVTIAIGGIDTKIKMSTIASIEDLYDIPTIQEEPAPPIDKQVIIEKVVVEDPLKDFKGFLLAKGNNVYVYYANTDQDAEAKYDKAGAAVIGGMIKSDGFWNVVDNMQDAHFTINYVVDTRRSDKAVLSISSWRSGKARSLGFKDTSESVEDNSERARKYYKHIIRPLQKKIEKGHLSKSWIEDFTVK